MFKENLFCYNDDSYAGGIKLIFVYEYFDEDDDVWKGHLLAFSHDDKSALVVKTSYTDDEIPILDRVRLSDSSGRYGDMNIRIINPTKDVIKMHVTYQTTIIDYDKFNRISCILTDEIRICPCNTSSVSVEGYRPIGEMFHKTYALPDPTRPPTHRERWFEGMTIVAKYANTVHGLLRFRIFKLADA